MEHCPEDGITGDAEQLNHARQLSEWEASRIGLRAGLSSFAPHRQNRSGGDNNESGIGESQQSRVVLVQVSTNAENNSIFPEVRADRGFRLFRHGNQELGAKAKADAKICRISATICEHLHARQDAKREFRRLSTRSTSKLPRF